ncbi:MAG TPA: hypothetical protein VGE25_05640 [Sediminibacterium sp.]
MNKLRELQTILKLVFGIVPIVAGIDKFFNLLTYWPNYMAGSLQEIMPIEISLFMKLVGVIEISAGILVLFRPLLGAYVVMLWLIVLALQLIFGGNHFDVAVRDLVMAAAAYGLVLVSSLIQQKLADDKVISRMRS